MAMRLRNPLSAREGQILVAVCGLGAFTWCFWLFDSPLSLFLGMYAIFGALAGLLALAARGRDLDPGGLDSGLDGDGAGREAGAPGSEAAPAGEESA